MLCDVTGIVRILLGKGNELDAPSLRVSITDMLLFSNLTQPARVCMRACTCVS
jgi:hypothetical protein